MLYILKLNYASSFNNKLNFIKHFVACSTDARTLTMDCATERKSITIVVAFLLSFVSSCIWLSKQ